MSDRIAVMDGGKVLQFAPAVDVYRRPASRFVAEFIGEANVFSGTLVEADGVQSGPLLIRVPSHELAAGSAVVVLVRPERVRIGEHAAGAATSFDMEVTDVVFTGPSVRILGRVGDVPVQVSTSQEAPMSLDGSSLRVGWDLRDAFVMADV